VTPVEIRCPAPLRPGDTIGVTAPSSGVPVDLRPRLEHAVDLLRERGFEVLLGACLDGSGIVSAPAAERAAELTAMLADPAVRAVVPPWGGELAIDLVGLVDWDALRDAEPTWFVGYSDCCSVSMPLLTRTGWAGVHGANLMDTPYDAPSGLLHWLDVVRADGPIVQEAHGRHRASGFDDWAEDPTASTWRLDAAGDWRVLGAPAGGLDVSGVLVGGCVEVLGPLAGTPYGDVAGFGRAHADEGLVVLLEVAEDGALDVARALHGMRLAGWFTHARAVVVGRTAGPDAPGLTQHDAVLDALGGLGVPLLLDVEVGHVPPQMPLVLGAPTRVVADSTRREVHQTLR